MSTEANQRLDNRRTFAYETIGGLGVAFDHANEQDKRNALVLVADYAERPGVTAQELAHEYGQPFHQVMNSRYLAITKGYLKKSARGFAVTKEGEKAIAE